MYFEQRKHKRLKCKANVRVFNDTNSWSTKLVDISRAGLQIERPTGWLLGDAATRCEIMVGEKLKVDLDTEIAHCNFEFIGLRGEHENLTILCNLLHLMAIKSARDSAAKEPVPLQAD
ncbi:MAG: PilZ domain-containing protein [Pseudomonadota bacterium]